MTDTPIDSSILYSLKKAMTYSYVFAVFFSIYGTIIKLDQFLVPKMRASANVTPFSFLKTSLASCSLCSSSLLTMLLCKRLARFALRLTYYMTFECCHWDDVD
ncbi:hypothetical protein BCR42DRAFT_394965 [Absidia repens]|uniref:Uncharacterized protein n=1 Tax=Absidia repens TaxID=90262 RepID=A0A1X2I8V8_9FUNG|nr:hypothetical protein BCR42DRAFT_394965 [Absidia repens]